ncbi:MAG: murein biosynthesis integral membrane protein MurJ [Myxococcota bacterium]
MSEDAGRMAPGGPKPAGVGAIALALAAGVAASRALGYLRDVLLADRVGAGGEADAYYAAFQVPDLLNYLLAGGALAIAFIPLYNRVRNADGDPAAAKLFANILGWVAVVSVLGTAALWWYADALIALQFPRFSPAEHELTVRLTRIVLPAQVFFLTGGIARAVLMAHGRFTAQALAPVLYNVAVILGGWWTGTAEGFAWGVLVGSFLGPFLLAFALLLRSGLPRIRLRIAFDPSLRAYLWLALPLMLGLSLATVDEWYERWFGGLLATGTVAHLAYARKLMMAPVAIVGQAVGAALLPVLARLHANASEHEFGQTLDRTLQAAVSLALLAAGASFALARPLVEVVYRHGRFLEADAAAVAAILAVLSFGVPAWVVQQVAARAFYARGDTWRPMILGSVIALVAIPLYLHAGQDHGAPGLAGAGVLAMSLNAVATLAWARWRQASPRLGAFFASAARALLVACLSAWAVRALAGEPAADWSGAAFALARGASVYAALALGLGYLLGGPALRGALGRLWQRLARRPSR